MLQNAGMGRYDKDQLRKMFCDTRVNFDIFNQMASYVCSSKLY